LSFTERRHRYQFAIAHHLHITPLELARMSVDDVEAAMDWIDEVTRSHE